MTTATTGEGVPELLAALDAHRARGREAGESPARLARAEAQVWAILADRIRADLHEPASRAATQATMREVAAHDWILSPQRTGSWRSRARGRSRR